MYRKPLSRQESCHACAETNHYGRSLPSTLWLPRHGYGCSPTCDMQRVLQCCREIPDFKNDGDTCSPQVSSTRDDGQRYNLVLVAGFRIERSTCVLSVSIYLMEMPNPTRRSKLGACLARRRIMTTEVAQAVDRENGWNKRLEQTVGSLSSPVHNMQQVQCHSSTDWKRVLGKGQFWFTKQFAGFKSRW